MEYKMQNHWLRCAVLRSAWVSLAAVAGAPGALLAQAQPPAIVIPPAPASAATDRSALDAWLSRHAPAFASPDASTAGRFLLQVEVPSVQIYDMPDTAGLVVGRLEQGVEVEADVKAGEWYRIKRASGEPGWVLNAATASGTVMAVRPFPADRRIGYEAGALDPRVAQSLPRDQTPAGRGQQPDPERQRPQGAPIEPRLPLIDPSRVEPPSPLYRSEEIPVRDRWRIVKSLGLLPYKPLDPYNPNVLSPAADCPGRRRRRRPPRCNCLVTEWR